MARSGSKSTARTPRRHGSRPGSWISFLSGLGVGLLVAFAVYLWHPGGGVSIPGDYTDMQGAADVAAAGLRPALPAPEIEFYYKLPEMEVKVPEWETSTPSRAVEDKIKPGTYVLQVGSFKGREDAESAKAKLALQGIRAKIQRVVINGQDVWYRVHVGPFTKGREIDAMRLKLIEAGNDFILLRMGEGTT